MTTDPSASYLWSAGVKKAITLDLRSGVFTLTVLCRASLEPAEVDSTRGRDTTGAGRGAGRGAGGATGVRARARTGAGAGAGAGARLSPDEPLLITTEPSASYLWSAGVKKEMTLDLRSGVFTFTVRWRESFGSTTTLRSGSRLGAGAGAGVAKVRTAAGAGAAAGGPLAMTTCPVAS